MEVKKKGKWKNFGITAAQNLSRNSPWNTPLEFVFALFSSDASVLYQSLNRLLHFLVYLLNMFEVVLKISLP